MILTIFALVLELVIYAANGGNGDNDGHSGGCSGNGGGKRGSSDSGHGGNGGNGGNSTYDKGGDGGNVDWPPENSPSSFYKNKICQTMGGGQSLRL